MKDNFVLLQLLVCYFCCWLLLTFHLRCYLSQPVVDKSKVGAFYDTCWQTQAACEVPGLGKQTCYLASSPSGKMPFQLDVKWGQISPFHRDGSFSRHALPPLPVRGFWEFLHFSILFNCIYFIFPFSSHCKKENRWICAFPEDICRKWNANSRV